MTVDIWPSFRYGPDGQAAVFQSAADVPDGWKDHPSKVKGASAADTVEKRLGRPELMEALRNRGVQYAPNAGGGELARLLALSEPQGVEVDSNGRVLGAMEPEPVDPNQPGPNPLDPALVQGPLPDQLEFPDPQVPTTQRPFEPIPQPAEPVPPVAPQPPGLLGEEGASVGLDPRASFVGGLADAPAAFGGLDRDHDGHPGGSLPASPPALTGKNKADLQAIARAEGVGFAEDASNRELREAIEAGRAE